MKNKMVIEPRWLSLSEACEYAAMSDKTLLRFVGEGNIYGTKKGGKWYIDRFSIDAFMTSDEVFVDEAVERLKSEVL
jgi:excisionase family DNA binding protein